ncbi:T9SS type A sorting domain-containing protein [Flavobacterium zepuense]|uniref:T9SS type A sorting domain-containing protein n=1 Tax=Flavobacterium zepuense TaxID=2593302 RepID=A0A552UVF4_9FLAO|nr:T9SS type A sorting domain-containing protein [Flavobacterium zepuense]TRW22213.1 T9SS type A sorting domain-containing protein [Flavobacterium zepuense]
MKKITLKKTFALCTLLLAGHTATAQAPEIEWQKSFGSVGDDIFYDVAPTLDGGYISAGFSTHDPTYPNNIAVNAIMVKTDAAGELQWQHLYGGLGDERARKVLQNTDGTYLIAGETSSTPEGSAAILSDIWLLKIDSEGNEVWSKTFGGSDNEFLSSFEPTSDGGYVMCGYTFSNDGDVLGNHGDYDMWVVKLDTEFEIEWQACLGGETADYGYMATETPDGDFIVTGAVQPPDNPSEYGVYKLDSEGTTVWGATFGGGWHDSPYDIAFTPNGGYIIAGQDDSTDITDNLGGADAWLLKIDADGVQEWAKSYGSPGDDLAWGIVPVTGGYVVSGYTAADEMGAAGPNAWLFKIDEEGTVLLEETFGGNLFERFYAFKQTDDNGFILSGTSTSNDGDLTQNNGAFDAWLVKLSPDVLGLKNSTKNTLTLYPNPNNGIFTIGGDIVLDNATLNVYSTLGQLVYSDKVTQAMVLLPNLAAGVYQVQLTTGKATYSQRLVVE